MNDPEGALARACRNVNMKEPAQWAAAILASLSDLGYSVEPKGEGLDVRELLELVERVKEHKSDDRPMVTWVPAADMFTVAEFLRQALDRANRREMAALSGRATRRATNP